MRDRGGDDFERGVDIGFGGVAAEAEADAGARLGGGSPMAVRTCEGSTAPEEQAAPVEQARPLKSRAMMRASPSMPANVMLEVFGVRGALAALARASGTRESKPRSSLSRRLDMRCASESRAMSCDLRGFAEADDAGDIFRARAEAALVVATVEELAQASAAFDVESADTFGCVELVAREREKVELKRLHIDRNLSNGLHSVGSGNRCRLRAAMRPMSARG